MSTCMNFHSFDNIKVCQQTFAKSGLIVTALLPSANASLKKHKQVPFYNCSNSIVLRNEGNCFNVHKNMKKVES